MASKQNQLSRLTMNLFGIPYQFPAAVDPRVSNISSTIGKKYTENIMLEAPICTIIPGEPTYLPGKSTTKKITSASSSVNTSLKPKASIIPIIFSLSAIFP